MRCWDRAVLPSFAASRCCGPTTNRPASPPVNWPAHSVWAGAPGPTAVCNTPSSTTRFGLADWTEPGRALRVYTEVPPLDRHRLAQLPDWSHRAHDRLLTEHIDQLARTPTARPPTPPTITERLDRLQRPPALAHPSPAVTR